jgi:FkbM family methyltransferase
MKEIYNLLPQIMDTRAARVVMELGAYRGEDTAHLRRTFPNAQLYSFEPDPRNVEAMRRNGLPDKTALVEAAVSDRDGSASFHLSSAELSIAPAWVSDAEYSGSSSLKRPLGTSGVHPWLRFDATVVVPTLTLDTFVRERGIEYIDFIWADLQGAEDLMIAGGKSALSNASLLYTECTETSEYEGQIGLEEILERLPRRWEVVKRFPYDVLLRNMSYSFGAR